MNIEKRIRRENSKMTRTILTSLLIVILMPYMVYVLNEGGVFNNWEFYFALGCAVSVDLLLIVNTIRDYDEMYLNYSTYGRKLKIKEGLIGFAYSVSFDKIIYIDVIERKKADFEIVILIRKGKNNKRYINFNIGFARMHQQYMSIYNHLIAKETIVDYHCVLVRKGGSRKYPMLYLLFKNSYNSELSPKALDYVKKFMEEYNVA